MNQAPNKKGETSAVICFISGIAAVLMGYSVYSHLKTLHDRNTQPKEHVTKNGAKLEDSIRLKSLAYLTQSHNVNIQSSSVKIILERAMSGTYLNKIIAACAQDQPIDIRSKALPSLQLLTRKEHNRAALLNAGALNVLVDALKCTDAEMKEVTQRYVAVAICDLIQNSDANKYNILDLGVLDPIKRILTSDEIRNNELKYWTLMILYQISLSDPLPKVLIEKGFVSLLARMARMTYGNTNMPKFCMQSLVRIAANVDCSEAKKVLTELLDYNIVELISNCLRGEDVELIYWAAGLMHEFVLKEVAADKFRTIKGIHTILAGLLSAEEMYISRVILRTIKFMAYGQDQFRHEMVRSGMVKKIMHCLSLDDEDVRYWAILCIHVVAGQVESHEDIITAPEFEVLLELAVSTKIKVSIFVSDILSLICCITSNNTYMEPNLNLIVKTLNTLLLEGELDVQNNAAGAIFNVMTMTFAFASKVRVTCFETLALMATSATHERVQMTCTKGALTIVITNRFLIPQINESVAEPLVRTVNTLSQLILPIIMIQSLVEAAQEEQIGSKKGFNLHDAMHVKLDDQDREILESRPTSSRSTVDEEEEEVDRPPDYIDVSEQGTISNASRLDRVLKEREQRKKHKKSNVELVDLLTHEDISFLFDMTISNVERELLFTKYEIPVSARNQLVGALTALNILLENDEMVGKVVTGETFKNLDVLDDLVIDIDDIDSSIYRTRSQQNGKNGLVKAAAGSPLPDHIKKLVQSLVYLAMIPILQKWSAAKFRNYPLHLLTETRTKELYGDVTDWIRKFEVLSPQAEAVYTSDTSDELAQGQRIALPFKPNRGYSARSSDMSSDSEDEDDSSEEEGLISIFPQRPTRQEKVNEMRRKVFASRGLALLTSLTRYASVRQYLVEKMHIIPILMYLFEDYSLLTNRVMQCLGGLFGNDPLIAIPESSFQVLAILLWRGMRVPILSRNPCFRFHAHQVLVYCSRSVSSDIKSAATNNPAFTEIDLISRSKFCVINYESLLAVRNNSWTFESVRATRCVPAALLDYEAPRKYAYEVKLESDGLMQIGWANEHFEFDPEGGKGVGDDIHSYGYDGYRAKKWHGRYSSMRTSYGLKWAEGDVITCCIDMHVGEIRYLKNGEDMGVAFYGVAITRAWYPAISLATGQQCKFQFGGVMDPLRYLPEGYTPVGALVDSSPTNVKLPPPHFTRSTNTTLIEHDDAKPTELDNSPVSSQAPIPYDDGSAEPSLKPVDGGLTKLTKPVNISVPEIEAAQNHASEQILLAVTKPNNYMLNPIPSLYYETTIAFLQAEVDSQSLFSFGMQSLSPGENFRFVYDRLDHQCELHIGSCQSEPFSLDIVDGDKIGVIYIRETHAVGLTHNESVKAYVYLENDIKTIPYLPFVTGQMKAEINYGEEPLSWKVADNVSSKQHISSYLHMLLGKRTSHLV